MNKSEIWKSRISRRYFIPVKQRKRRETGFILRRRRPFFVVGWRQTFLPAFSWRECGRPIASSEIEGIACLQKFGKITRSLKNKSPGKYPVSYFTYPSRLGAIRVLVFHRERIPSLRGQFPGRICSFSCWRRVSGLVEPAADFLSFCALCWGRPLGHARRPFLRHVFNLTNCSINEKI